MHLDDFTPATTLYIVTLLPSLLRAKQELASAHPTTQDTAKSKKRRLQHVESELYCGPVATELSCRNGLAWKSACRPASLRARVQLEQKDLGRTALLHSGSVYGYFILLPSSFRTLGLSAAALLTPGHRQTAQASRLLRTSDALAAGGSVLNSSVPRKQSPGERYRSDADCLLSLRRSEVRSSLQAASISASRNAPTLSSHQIPASQPPSSPSSMVQPFPSNSPPIPALRRPLPLARASTDLPTKGKGTRFSFPKTPDVDEEDGPIRQRESSTVSPPRHLLMRSRRVSSPANLVQTHTHSIAESGGSYFGAAGNRMSVASMSSFDSLPEEDEEATTPNGGMVEASAGRAPPLRRSVSPSRRTPLPRPVSFAPQGSARPANPKRNSLPSPPAFDGSYRPFSLGPMPMIRSTSRSSSRGRTSPLGKEATEDQVVETGRKGTATERVQEKLKREEKRWNVAEELRETERAYLTVLEEINEVGSIAAMMDADLTPSPPFTALLPATAQRPSTHRPSSSSHFHSDLGSFGAHLTHPSPDYLSARFHLHASAPH